MIISKLFFNRYTASVVGALVTIAGIYYTGYRAGAHSVMKGLQDDRIQILRDGREIDKTIDNLDGSGLCSVLGGC